jgi:hypothetical protein
MSERRGSSPQKREASGASNQRAVPPHENPRYLGLLKGFCPSTGQPCERLGDLRFQRDVSGDSFGMAGGTFGSMTAGQGEAYARRTQEALQIAELTQRALNGDCRRSCALDSTKRR